MASSTRFFSRNRLARSKCLLTSAAIRPGCLCFACRLTRKSCARSCAGRGANALAQLYTARRRRAKLPQYDDAVCSTAECGAKKRAADVPKGHGKRGLEARRMLPERVTGERAALRCDL